MKKDEKISKEEGCWHSSHFVLKQDPNDSSIVDLSYRLNEVLIEKIGDTTKFNLERINQLVDLEIDFFKNRFDEFQNTVVKKIIEYNPKQFITFSIESPVNLFKMTARQAGRSYSYAMIGDAPKIIRNTVALECSSLALENLFLYRGAKVKNDKPCSESTNLHSLSYGSSLFAGCQYDEGTKGATAFSYMLDPSNQAFVLVVPMNTPKEKSPFYIPCTYSYTLPQLFSSGEFFHARSNLWKGESFSGGELIECDLSKEELVEGIEKAYHEQLILLN